MNIKTIRNFRYLFRLELIMHYVVPDDQSRNNTGIPQPYRKYRYYPYPEDIRYLQGARKGITSLLRYYTSVLHFCIIAHAGPVPRPLTLPVTIKSQNLLLKRGHNTRHPKQFYSLIHLGRNTCNKIIFLKTQNICKSILNIEQQRVLA